MTPRITMLVAAAAALAALVAMPAAGEAKPSGKPGVERTKRPPRFKTRIFRPRYYRRLSPASVRRSLTGEQPTPQIAPRAIPGT